jgi:hypothetical protein
MSSDGGSLPVAAATSPTLQLPRPSQQRFLVVVRDTDDAGDASSTGARSPTAAESSRRLLQHTSAGDEVIEIDGELYSDEDSEVDEVDVDAVANEIGVSAQDLVRYLHENPQLSVDEPRRVHTMLKCHAMVTGSRRRFLPPVAPAPTPVSSSPQLSDQTALDASSGGQPTTSGASPSASNFHRPPLFPQLVTLGFATGEDGGLVGGRSEMTRSPEPGAPREQTPSQLVFKCSGSNFSQSSQRHLSDVSTPGRPEKKGIYFANNVVTNVIVYEVDQELFVGVEYARHWIGWASLLLGLVLEIVFDVHIGWFVYVERAGAGYLSVQNWVCVVRALVSALYMACCILLGIGVAPSLQYCFSCKGLSITTLMSFCLGGALALEVVTSELANTPHFFTTSILHCAWIIAFRMFMKQMVFFAEIIGVVVAIVGFIMTNIHVDESISFYTDAVGNVLMLMCSLLYAAYFLLQEYLRARSPSAPIVFNIGMVAPIIGFIVGVSYSVPINAGADGLYGMFQSENIVHTSLLAIEGLGVNVFFLAALMYLDLLSVSACYALKSVFAPMCLHYIVWLNNPEYQPSVDRQQWDAWFFCGLAVVIGGSGTVIYFASVKRSYVARRIAHHSRRAAPNPYRKRRGAAQSTMGHFAQQQQQAEQQIGGVDHLVNRADDPSQRSLSPPRGASRRSSVDSRLGNKRVVLSASQL